MKKTLQDQYLSIKEGKGHKGVFLTEAKRQFPNIVRNAATFDEAVLSLKTKNIISENVLMVMPAVMDRPKKESYETAFEAFLAEAKKKKDEDENVKAEEKKVSKPVEKDLEKNFDNSDEKNPDNMIFDQIMMGYYAEMKDPKNADKTMQELKDIVFKNLSKDPIYYTKDGQFGIKDLGYVTEHPGLGEPKEAKGKYKSSGYGDLKESIQPNQRRR
jgi:lipopolysaccharide biosynthesis regulator YciM